MVKAATLRFAPPIIIGILFFFAGLLVGVFQVTWPAAGCWLQVTLLQVAGLQVALQFTCLPLLIFSKYKTEIERTKELSNTLNWESEITNIWQFTLPEPLAFHSFPAGLHLWCPQGACHCGALSDLPWSTNQSEVKHQQPRHGNLLLVQLGALKHTGSCRDWLQCGQR